mgnify:CR=1 FL=1
MRYALTTGTVYLTVFEYDKDGNQTQWSEKSFTGGNWTWVQNNISFITHPDTAYCKVRFGIGGQIDEYLDADLQEDFVSQ